MAYIKVNHSKFARTAEEVEDYVLVMKAMMSRAQEDVNLLLSSWKGDDANVFNSKWSTITENGSTYAGMVKSLESYAKVLRFAGEKYKNAQINAVNRANSLSRW